MLGKNPASTWAALVTSALLGTDRRPPSIGPDAPDVVAQAGSDNPPHTLMIAASVVSLQRRAGCVPAVASTPLPPPAPPETQPHCSSRASAYLDDVMGRSVRLLTEWLLHVGRKGQRARHAQLPRLFDFATDWKQLAPGVALVGGERGRWLAAQNPRWAHIARVTDADTRAFLASQPPTLELDDALNALDTTSDTVPNLSLLKLLSARQVASGELVALLLDRLLARPGSNVAHTTAQTLDQLATAVLPDYLPGLIARLRGLHDTGIRGLDAPLQTAEFRQAMLKELNRD